MKVVQFFATPCMIGSGTSVEEWSCSGNCIGNAFIACIIGTVTCKLLNPPDTCIA